MKPCGKTPAPSRSTTKLRLPHQLREHCEVVQTRCSEPDTQERVAVLHYRSHRQSNVFLALSATQNTWTVRKATRLILLLTVRADETVAPSRALQIRGAGPIFRKQPLKLRQRVRKRKIVTPENICSRWMKRHLHDCAAFTEVAQVYM
jgi:hypothetical protein